MKTQALVIANDPVYVGWLRNAAGATMDVQLVPANGSPEDLAALIESQTRVDIVFCEFDSQSQVLRAALIELLLEHHWPTPVVGLGADDNPDWVLAAMRAGARDFFVLRRDDATLAVQIGRLLRRSAPPPQVANASLGKLFGVMSCDTREASAFLGEHMALALVEGLESGARALLVDLASPAGAGAIFLNVKQAYSVLDAINDVQRCDRTLVDTAFPRHSSGLYVLSLPEDLLGRPSLDVDDALRLLQVLRSLFAFVVVTMDGNLPFDALVGMANQVDRLAVVSDQSILQSRRTKHLLRALRLQGCSLDRAGLVVDNYRRRVGLEPPNLAELFDLPLLSTLHLDESHRSVAMNTGEPLFSVARKDP